MKRQSFLVTVLTLGIAGALMIAVWANRPGVSAVNSKQAADGAFRDGYYQAKLDVRSGREPHMASGRWSADADRASFVAGYQQGYREFSEARNGKLAKPGEAKLAGHRAE